MIRGLHLHFDAPSGAAGDMTLGALFDLGVPEDVVRGTLAALGVDGFELVVARNALRRGMAGTDVKVVLAAEDRHRHHHHHTSDEADAHHHDHDSDHPHRYHRDIVALILARTSGRTQELALAIFDRVARAEAHLHGVPVADVSFHEVGAIDSIVDIVGTAAAIAWLAPSSVSASPLPLGHGVIETSHGRLPVPSPAALEICRAAGVPTYDGGIATELLTPTGAAILATIVGTWGPAPPLRVRAIGYGAGDADLADRPNLLRATVGEPHGGPAVADPTTTTDTADTTNTTNTTNTIVELAANLDDMNPELCEHVAERLFHAGALDVWFAPVIMKKSRPAFVIAVLAPAARQATLTDILLAETTTLGVRAHAVTRRALERSLETVATAYGDIVVKVGFLPPRSSGSPRSPRSPETVLNAAPEYESCRSAARAHGVPLKEVYAAAIAAFRSRRS